MLVHSLIALPQAGLALVPTWVVAPALAPPTVVQGAAGNDKRVAHYQGEEAPVEDSHRIQRGGWYGGPFTSAHAQVPSRWPRQMRWRQDSLRSALRSRSCDQTMRR